MQNIQLLLNPHFYANPSHTHPAAASAVMARLSVLALEATLLALPWLLKPVPLEPDSLIATAAAMAVAEAFSRCTPDACSCTAAWHCC
jgi:hypothetical protein